MNSKKNICKKCNVESGGNFCGKCGKKINQVCKICWVTKRKNYKCGYDKCPGHKLLKKGEKK